VPPVRPQGPPPTSGSSLGSEPAKGEPRWGRLAIQLARRGSALLTTLLALLTLAELVRADDLVPIQLEAQLFAKVLTYDKNFPERAGQLARVLLVMKKDHADSVRVASQMQSALRSIPPIGGIPHEEIVVPFDSAAALADLVKASGAAAVFLGPGFDDDVDAIKTALDGHDVLTAGSVPEYVPHGIVLGFDIVSGSPKVLVHLTQAKRQHVSLRAELLRLARIFE
jgi:YfiR/HmsC-like